MKWMKHIVMMCLVAVVAVSCKSTEPVMRTEGSSRMLFSRAVASGTSEGETYRGIIASKTSDGSQWMTAPSNSYCTEWECTFGGGEGDFRTTRYHLYYPEGTYNFYALGYNGSGQFRAENGTTMVKAKGGVTGANDYIMATLSDVELDGVNDVECSLAFYHLFAQVRFELKVRTVDVTESLDEVLESVELVDVSELGYRLNGVIDLAEEPTDGVWMTPDNADSKKLGDVTFGVRYMVVPHSGVYQPKDATIKVKIDGRDFSVPVSGADNLRLEPGKCRVLRMTYNGVSVQAVGVPQWSVGEEIVVGNRDLNGDGKWDGVQVPQWGK